MSNVMRLLPGAWRIAGHLWMGVVKVSRVAALDLLEGHNRCNRPLSLPHARKLAQDMTAGRWMLGEPLIFDRDGQIHDAQHRLKAVAECGLEIEFTAIVGVDPGIAEVVNSGRKKSIGDRLHMRGYKNTSTLASALACLNSYTKIGHFAARELPMHAAKKLLENYPSLSTTINESVKYCKWMRSGTIVTLLCWLFDRTGSNNGKTFFSRIHDSSLPSEPEWDGARHAIHRIRELIGKEKSARPGAAGVYREEIAMCLIHAFNQWQTRSRFKRIRFSDKLLQIHGLEYEKGLVKLPPDAEVQ
jgi:hypothetical protein